jgi:adenylate cyclase
MRLAHRWMPFLVAVSAVAALLLLRGQDPGFLQAQRAAGFDTLQRLWPRQPDQDQPVRIVDIDEKSLKAFGQWPWPRDQLAKMTRNLADLGAAVVAFDIIFPEPDRLSPKRLSENPDYAGFIKTDSPLPDTDQAFAEALASTQTVLAFARGEQRPASTLPVKSSIAQTGQSVSGAAPLIIDVTANIAPLEAAATGLGNINIGLGSEQGVARSVPLLRSDGERLLPALSIEALRVAQGADALVVHGNAETPDIIEALSVGAVELPVTEVGFFQLYFRPNDQSLYISAADILDAAQQEKLRPEIDGRIILVGTSATGLLDSRATPLGETVPGVSVHAQAIEQIISGQFLSRPEWIVGAELLASTIIALFTAMIAAIARPAMAVGFGAASALAIAAVSGLAFTQSGLLIDASFPMLLLVGSFLTSIAWRLLVTDRQGRLMRNVFGHYVAPTVLAEIERNPEGLKLGGEVRDITVMFLDIENFTPLSEKLKPDELVAVVNGLWDVCSKSILAENGTIDKYIGDAVMAFWNAPLACEAHQYRACKAALAMRDALHAYNHTPKVRSTLEAIDAWPLGTRIGIATGPACVGNMGSTDRFDYSVIGETVNTASRAEAASKHVAHDIVIAGNVAKETEKLAILSAGFVNLKGRSTRQPLTAVVGSEEMASTTAFGLLVKDLPILIKGKSRKAAHRELFKELALHHPAATRFLERVPERLSDYSA